MVSKKPTGRLAVFPPDTRPRYFLFFIAVALHLIACAVSGVGYSTYATIYWMAGMAIWILWFFVMFLIVTPQTDTFLLRARGGLKKTATVILIVLLAVGFCEGFILGLFAPGYIKSGASNDFVRSLEQLAHGFQYNDGTALIQQASENLLEGKNPYEHGNIIEAFLKYGGSYDRVTPIQEGRFKDVWPYPTQAQLKEIWDKAITDPSHPPVEIESHVCYPAGSFVLPAPFIAAGIKDIRIIYLLFVIAGLVYAIWRIKKKWKLLFICVALVSLEVWNGVAIGEAGAVIFPFLLIAWVTLGENDWLSAIFMGLAVATKQNAWFFLPVYLILMWRTSPRINVAAAIGIIAVIFLAFNAYFIIQNPGLWLESVASPMAEPIFPLGVGVISLVTGGIVSSANSLPFTIMEIVVFIGVIIWYYRNCKHYPDAGPLLAVLPLFFAWRSLWTYFFYITIIILARMLIRNESAPAAQPIQRERIS